MNPLSALKNLKTAFGPRPALRPLADRGPLRVMFIITSMPVGGAETLLVALARRLDRNRFLPELCCLKHLDVLGEVLARDIPAHAGLLVNKYDLRVLPRLVSLLRRRRIDAVVTVGCGDKMFWGRLAARIAGVPVICSALHSTGLPDRVGRLNRLLAPITDAFIAVAEPHARYMAEHEGCPTAKVRVIPNGVDPQRFQPSLADGELRRRFRLEPAQPVAAIVAALRPEKNHELLLRAAVQIRQELPQARILVVGDGPRRGMLESLARELGVDETVRFVGTQSDIPRVLALTDVVALTSHMEANPVSLLEAMASQKPVIATRVGSVPETVLDGQTGYLVAPGDEKQLAQRLIELLRTPKLASAMGRAGREQVLARWTEEHMTRGYEDLLSEIYDRKARGRPAPAEGDLLQRVGPIG
jgi:glycosyltransferase involved in cell wall biosynthesis